MSLIAANLNLQLSGAVSRLQEGDGALHGLKHQGEAEERHQGLCSRRRGPQRQPHVHVHQDDHRTVHEDCQVPERPHLNLQAQRICPCQRCQVILAGRLGIWAMEQCA
jgi:hypothetical protein